MDSEDSIKTIESNNKRKASMLEKYGVENPSQLEEFKEKRKNTFLDRYGVENPGQLEEFKEKIKATNLVKYGVENPGQLEEFKEKMIATNLVKYGFRHPMQNSAVFYKSVKNAYKIKEYKTITGKIFHYQGYEDVVLKFLIEELGIDENDIFTDKKIVPQIFYTHPRTNKQSRHYPDIWIQSLNLIIEVKSLYTLKKEPDVIFEKQAECKRQNMNYFIIVCSKKKILQIMI